MRAPTTAAAVGRSVPGARPRAGAVDLHRRGVRVRRRGQAPPRREGAAPVQGAHAPEVPNKDRQDGEVRPRHRLGGTLRHHVLRRGDRRGHDQRLPDAGVPSSREATDVPIGSQPAPPAEDEVADEAEGPTSEEIAGELAAELDKGNAALAGGNVDEAIAAYETVAAQAPDLPEVHHNLGLAYRKKGERRPRRSSGEPPSSIPTSPSRTAPSR